MKRIILAGVLSLSLAGCDYTMPLVDHPKLDIDKSLVGLWQRTNDDGKIERLLILPLSGQEYLVSFPACSTNAIFARACLWRGSGLVLVQLDWFGTAQGKVPEDTRTFQYAAYAVDNDSIMVRLLNPEVMPNDITSAKAFAKAIADNKENPNLFRDKIVFKKIKK